MKLRYATCVRSMASHNDHLSEMYHKYMISSSTAQDQRRHQQRRLQSPSQHKRRHHRHHRVADRRSDAPDKDYGEEVIWNFLITEMGGRELQFAISSLKIKYSFMSFVYIFTINSIYGLR